MAKLLGVLEVIDGVPRYIGHYAVEEALAALPCCSQGCLISLDFGFCRLITMSWPYTGREFDRQVRVLELVSQQTLCAKCAYIAGDALFKLARDSEDAVQRRREYNEEQQRKAAAQAKQASPLLYVTGDRVFRKRAKPREV